MGWSSVTTPSGILIYESPGGDLGVSSVSVPYFPTATCLLLFNCSGTFDQFIVVSFGFDRKSDVNPFGGTKDHIKVSFT